MNEVERAKEYLNRCYEVDSNLFGDESKEMATLFNNFGGLYDKKQEYDTALIYYEKSLRICLKLFKTTHPDIANSYNNIGAVHYEKKEYRKALEYFINSAKIELRSIGNSHVKLAVVYNNIAESYKALTNYQNAIKYYNKAFKIDPTDNEIYQIAICYEQLDNKEKALEIYLSLSNLLYENHGPSDLKVVKYVWETRRLINELNKDILLPEWMTEIDNDF